MQAICIAVALAVLAVLGNGQGIPQPGDCGISAIKPTEGFRIINGEEAIPHSRPYQLLFVGFHPNGTAKHYCGGSLITPTHVLTAAHCVEGTPAADIRIYPGLHEFTPDLLSKSKGVPVSQWIRHGSYSSSSLANDVAVMRLSVPVPVDNIKVSLVCLPPANSPACANGHPVVASGWGSMSGDPNRPPSSRPTHLQQVALNCIDGGSNSDCRSLTYLLGIIKDNSKMCAYAPNKGVCFGDSGGPLVRTRTLDDGRSYVEQVGIMSGTVDCSFTKPRPDIYADVRYFNKWILDQIKILS